MTKWLLVAGGGAFGSVLRYAVQGWAQRFAGAIFPWGTFAVNVTGCAVIGFLAAALAGPWLIREEYKVGLMVGVMGGYTTFSSFGLETFNLMNERQYAFAAANVALSCLMGLAAVWLGYRAAQHWLGV
jgi:CrcB protein